MSDFFQIFSPGMRHQQEQRDLEKILVVTEDAGGTGPKPMDLDSGNVLLRVPNQLEPPTPTPDDKDWTWVLERRCDECGFDASAVATAELAALVIEATGGWPAVLARPNAAVRPSAQMWSPLEYGCHVRDVLELFTERLKLMLTRDDPTFANWDQDATAIADAYWKADPGVVSRQLATAAHANAAAWAGVAEDEWTRPGHRSNGSAFTVASLGRYQLHDLVHHRHDVGA